MLWWPQLRTWAWKTTDRLAIWWAGQFGSDPKQRALEWKQDHIRNKLLDQDIDKALGLNNQEDNKNE